ncbi:unnamed protein product [Allacma fusca]|uniref:Uncharacterized protein n=1 Tax=Allacma fusca TaxID=39272 RepID=A0A8J2PJN0_9HEXA|nr:unnamed protein product [Allacma fusca]
MNSSGNHPYITVAVGNDVVSKARASTRNRVKQSLTETMATFSRPKTIVNYMKDRVAAVRDRDVRDAVDSTKSQLAEVMESVYFTENALLETRRQLDAVMRERDRLQAENSQLRQDLLFKKDGSNSGCCKQLDFVTKDRAHLQLVNNQLRKELLNTLDELVSSLAEANRAQKRLAELESRMKPGLSRSDAILKSRVLPLGTAAFDKVSSTNQLEAPMTEIRVDFNKKISTYRKMSESDAY